MIETSIDFQFMHKTNCDNQPSIHTQTIDEQEENDLILMLKLPEDDEKNRQVKWSRGGQRALGNDRFRPYKTSLAIRQLTSDDAGIYSAESEDTYGTSMLASIDLNVQKRKPEVPIFLKRLNDMSVKIGSRARFLVEIENVPPLKVTWYHDNQILRKNERLNFLEEDRFYCLDVGWTVLPDEGHWTCIAENKHGCSVSSAYLTILVPKAYKTPRFVDELKAILAEDGTVSLECKVIGVPTPMLHWYKDGKKITAGDTFALRANSSDSSSLGTYSCVAKNCLGQAFSSSSVHFHNEGQLSDKSAFLLGPQPKFVRELQNAETQIEAPLTLSCQVVVPPWPKTIDWYNKNGRVVENDKYKMIADGLGMYAMEIKKVEMMDEGEWKCVATSFFGIKAFTSCFITVKFPKNYKLPKFLENLQAVMTPEGLVSFECKVVGYPTPQLKWLKDGKELKPGDVYQLTGTNSLGTYCCIAKNSMGEISSTTVLTLEDIQSQLTEEERLMIFAINQPPYFVKGLSSHELEINEEFKFHVQVSAKPDPKIFWYRNDELIEKNERITMQKEEHGNFFLFIKRAILKDQAEWRAVAVNDYGQSVTSCFVKLVVPKHFKGPRFLEELKATLTKEGTVNLECKVIGIPQPELRWYKDGKCLKSGEMHRIISGTNGTCRLGMYTCEALNCMGTVTSSASLLAYEEETHDETTKLRKNNNLDILSIITEERSSQMNNSDKSMTYEEAANVSFSFDGKEVSISLYETPDLTEEEALQIVEMYANELTDQISDQNIVELPSLRFVKETVTSGNILMEATVIDVPPNEFCVEEELKTDADVENSMMDDSALLNNNSTSLDVDKTNADFPRIHSGQHLNEALFPKISNEGSASSNNKQAIGDSLKTSVLSSNTNIVDDISIEENQQKITPLQTPLPRTIRQETIQKHVSFDSEDDSLYEFEKRKAQEKLQQTAESSSFFASTIVNCSSLLDKKNLSPLESTALSISTLELDLNKIKNDLICSKDLEKDVINCTLNVLDSLLQPTHEVKNSLESIENSLNVGDIEEKEININALHESIQKIQHVLSKLDEDENYKNDHVLRSRRQSILGVVVKPLIEIEESLKLLSMEHLKPSRPTSFSEEDVDDQSDPSSNDDSEQSGPTSIISDDARKMIVILNEYNKELENLDALIQQKRDSVQYDNNLLQICENLNSVVQQVKNVRDWSITMHKNSSNFPLFGLEHVSNILEYNTTVLQFLDTNINVVKAALQTSTGFSQIEKFLDDTSLVRENLETTLTLTSKLSPITTLNYLTDALKSYTSISNQFPKNKCFLQDVLAVNPDCIRSINGSIEIILNSLDTIEKCSQVESLYHKKRILLALYRLEMPLKHLDMTLHSVEKQILNHEDGISNMTGLQVYKLVNIISEPLQMVRKDISIILNDCQLQEGTHKTTDTLLTLVVPSLRDFQDTITAFHSIIFDKEPGSIDANYVLSALNNLNPPLCELASNMLKVEELILLDAPVVSDPRLGIRIVIQSISSLIEAISCLQSNLPENNSTVGALSRLNEPLQEVKNSFKEINNRFYLEDPKKVNITMLKTLSTPFNQLQKELIEASNILSGDIKNTISDLQRTILTIQDQVSFEYGDEPASIEYNIMTLQTLLQPLNVLRNHCVTIKDDLESETPSLADIIDSLEKEQMKIVNDIDYLLEELMKDPADQHYPPNLIRAIHSTLHFLKKYKALLTTLREPNSIQNDSLGHDVKRVLAEMHFDFDKIEQNIESEELKCELGKIVGSVLNIEQASNLLSLHASLQSLSSLTPVFSKILLELEVLSKVDIQDVDSVECFIAFLQSLNTLRTLQDNVRNFHSSSNTDSIQIPMLLSFLGSCERLEIKVSELLSIVENCADQNVKLDSLFYKQAIEAFTTLNNQLIHLNKCLIDQSMSDDNQKEIPFETSINNFATLLETIDAESENDLLKEVYTIINQGIIDELKRLKNDILFNMSLIQSEDEITFNESDQCEDALPGSNPDLVSVCLKSIKNEIRKCDKYFDKMNGIKFEQKVAYVDNIHSSLENIYNILNFVNQNVSLEGEEKCILTLQQPIMHMLQQIHKIKVFLSMGDAQNSSLENNISPKLTNLYQSFELFKSSLASYNCAYATGTSSSEASSSKPASYTASDKISALTADASEDMTDSIYNDLSSSTESADYTTVKPNQIFDLSISEASVEEKSLAADSSSPSSDILSDLKVPETESITLHVEITERVEISTNKTNDRNTIELDQCVDDRTVSSINIGEVINEVKALAMEDDAESTVPDEKTSLPTDQSIQNELEICKLSVLEASLATGHNIESNYASKLETIEENDLKLYADQREEDNNIHPLLEVKTALLQESSTIDKSQEDHSLTKIDKNKDAIETNLQETITVSQMIDKVENSLSVDQYLGDDSTTAKNSQELDTPALIPTETEEQKNRRKSPVDVLSSSYEQCRFIPGNEVLVLEVDTSYSADQQHEKVTISNETNFDMGNEPTSQKVEEFESKISESIDTNFPTSKTTRDTYSESELKTIEDSNNENVEGLTSDEIQDAIQKIIVENPEDSTELSVREDDVQAEPKSIAEGDKTSLNLTKDSLSEYEQNEIQEAIQKTIVQNPEYRTELAVKEEDIQAEPESIAEVDRTSLDPTKDSLSELEQKTIEDSNNENLEGFTSNEDQEDIQKTIVQNPEDSTELAVKEEDIQAEPESIAEVDRTSLDPTKDSLSEYEPTPIEDSNDEKVEGFTSDEIQEATHQKIVENPEDSTELAVREEDIQAEPESIAEVDETPLESTKDSLSELEQKTIEDSNNENVEGFTSDEIQEATQKIIVENPEDSTELSVREDDVQAEPKSIAEGDKTSLNLTKDSLSEYEQNEIQEAIQKTIVQNPEYRTELAVKEEDIQAEPESIAEVDRTSLDPTKDSLSELEQKTIEDSNNENLEGFTSNEDQEDIQKTIVQNPEDSTELAVKEEDIQAEPESIAEVDRTSLDPTKDSLSEYEPTPIEDSNDEKVEGFTSDEIQEATHQKIVENPEDSTELAVREEDIQAEPESIAEVDETPLESTKDSLSELEQKTIEDSNNENVEGFTSDEIQEATHQTIVENPEDSTELAVREEDIQAEPESMAEGDKTWESRLEKESMEISLNNTWENTEIEITSNESEKGDISGTDIRNLDSKMEKVGDIQKLREATEEGNKSYEIRIEVNATETTTQVLMEKSDDNLKNLAKQDTEANIEKLVSEKESIKTEEHLQTPLVSEGTMEMIQEIREDNIEMLEEAGITLEKLVRITENQESENENFEAQGRKNIQELKIVESEIPQVEIIQTELELGQEKSEIVYSNQDSETEIIPLVNIQNPQTGLVTENVQVMENLKKVNKNSQLELIERLEEALTDEIMKLEIEDQSNIGDGKLVDGKIELQAPELKVMMEAPVRLPINSSQHNIAEDEKLEIMEKELMDVAKPVDLKTLTEREDENIESIQQATKDLCPEEKRPSVDIEPEEFPQSQTSQQKIQICIGDEPESNETSKRDLSSPVALPIEEEKTSMITDENLNDRKREEDRTSHNILETENREVDYLEALNENQEDGSIQKLERSAMKTSSSDLISGSSLQSIDIEETELETQRQMVDTATQNMSTEKFGVINLIKSKDLQVEIPVVESTVSLNIEENLQVADTSEENDSLHSKMIEKKILIEFQEPVKPKLCQRATSLVREDTVEEYWDLKDNDCTLECSTTHKHPNLVSSLSDSCSLQESFETAVDDLENSECDELMDLENTFADKDDLNENLQLERAVFSLEEEKACKKLELRRQSTENLELVEEINRELADNILTKIIDTLDIKAEKSEEIKCDINLQTPQVEEVEFPSSIVNENPEIEECDLYQHNSTSESIDYKVVQPTENDEESVKNEMEIETQLNDQHPLMVEEPPPKESVEEQTDAEENLIADIDRESSQSKKVVEVEVSPENLEMIVQTFPVDTFEHECVQIKVGIGEESTAECTFPELVTNEIVQPIEDGKREIFLEELITENQTFEKCQIHDLENRECFLLDVSMEKESNIDGFELKIVSPDSSTKTLNIENKDGGKNITECGIKNENSTKEVEKMDGRDNMSLETGEEQESIVQKIRCKNMTSFEELLEQDKSTKEETLKIEAPDTRMQHYIQECTNSGSNMAVFIPEKVEHEVAQDVEVCLETNKDADNVTKYIDEHSELQKEELEILSPNSAVNYLESSPQLQTDEHTNLTAEISRADSGNWKMEKLSQLDDNIEENLLAKKIDPDTKTCEIDQDLREKSLELQEKLHPQNIDLENKTLDENSQKLTAVKKYSPSEENTGTKNISASLIEDEKLGIPIAEIETSNINFENCLKPDNSVNFESAIEKIEVKIETPKINVQNYTVEECSRAKKGVKEDSIIKKCELEIGSMNATIEFINEKELDLPQKADLEKIEIKTMIMENENSRGKKTEDAEELQNTEREEDKIICTPLPEQNIQILEEEREVVEITKNEMEDDEKFEQCIEEWSSIPEEMDKTDRCNVENKELENLSNFGDLGPTKNQGRTENKTLADVKGFEESGIEEKEERTATIELASENQPMKQNQDKCNNTKLRKESNQTMSIIPSSIEDSIDTLLESNKEKKTLFPSEPGDTEEIKIEKQQELMEGSEKSVIQEIIPRINAEMNKENQFRKSNKDNQSQSIFIDSDELNPEKDNSEERLEVERIEVEFCIRNLTMMTEPRNMRQDIGSISKEEDKLELLHSMEQKLFLTNESSEDNIENDQATNRVIISESEEITRQKGPNHKEQKIKENCDFESNVREQDTKQKSDGISEDLSKSIKKFNLIEKQSPEETIEVEQRDIQKMPESSETVEESDAQMCPIVEINNSIEDEINNRDKPNDLVISESEGVTQLRESEEKDQKQRRLSDSEFVGKNQDASKESDKKPEDSSDSIKKIESIERISQDETKEVKCKEADRTQEKSERIEELDSQKGLITKLEEFTKEKMRLEGETDTLVILETTDVTKLRQTDQKGEKLKENNDFDSEEGNQCAKQESNRILEDWSKSVEKCKPIKNKSQEETTKIQQRKAEEIQENSQIEGKLNAQECPITKTKKSTEDDDKKENKDEQNESLIVDLESMKVTKPRKLEQEDQKQKKTCEFKSEEGSQDAKQESNTILEDGSKSVKKCAPITKQSQEKSAEIEQKKADGFQENSPIQEKLIAQECPMTKTKESTEDDDTIENKDELNDSAIVDLVKSEEVTKPRKLEQEDPNQEKNHDCESKEGNQGAKQESNKIMEKFPKPVEKCKPIKKKSQKKSKKVEIKEIEKMQEGSRIKDKLDAQEYPLAKKEKGSEDDVENEGEQGSLVPKFEDVAKPSKVGNQKQRKNCKLRKNNSDAIQESDKNLDDSPKFVTKCESMEKEPQNEIMEAALKENKEVQEGSKIMEILDAQEGSITISKESVETKIEIGEVTNELESKEVSQLRGKEEEDQKQLKSGEEEQDASQEPLELTKKSKLIERKLHQNEADEKEGIEKKENSDDIFEEHISQRDPHAAPECSIIVGMTEGAIIDKLKEQSDSFSEPEFAGKAEDGILLYKAKKEPEVLVAQSDDIKRFNSIKKNNLRKKSIDSSCANSLDVKISKVEIQEEEEEEEEVIPAREKKYHAIKEAHSRINQNDLLINHYLCNQTDEVCTDKSRQMDKVSTFKPSNVPIYPQQKENWVADHQFEYYRYSPKYYHHVARDQNDIQQMKTLSSSCNDRLTHGLHLTFDDLNSDYNTDSSYLKHRRHSEIPEVKISKSDMLHNHFSRLCDQTTRFLCPDRYCSQASSIDRSSRASSASRDISNDSLYLSTNGRQRYLSTSTSDDFLADYRPVSAPPNLIHDAYKQTDLYSRPNSPLYKPSTYTKLHFRDDIYLDYEYLRGNNRKEFKYIPKSYLPRHHMYLHSNCNYLDSSSFSFEFYHPRCPYCRILYLRYQANNWSDYLWPERNNFQRRYDGGLQSSDMSYSAALKAYRYQIFDGDTLNYINSRRAKMYNIGPKWLSCSDIKTTIPSQINQCVYRSREAEDFVKKHFWDDKHPTRVYFSDSVPIYRPQSFPGINSIKHHIPPIKYSPGLGLSPRFKQLCVEDRVPFEGTVTFNAKVEGIPKPNIEWLKEEKTLQPTPLRFQYNEDTDLHTFIISDISQSDAGRYRCKIWNKYGVADAYTSINVVTTDRGKPPRFITRPETIMCIICNSDLSVSFRLSGDPKPRVLWMKGLTDITETHRTLKETINDYVRLTLKRAQISDAGTYFIIAKNKFGTDRAFFTLRVDQRSRSLTPLPFYKHVMDVRESCVPHANNTSNFYHSKLSHYNNYQSSRLRNHINSIRLRLIHSRSSFLINRAFV